MSDKDQGQDDQDSRTHIRPFSPEVLNTIQGSRSDILAAAQAAGVSPIAVAGPMAREMNRREDHNSALMWVRDEQSRQNALYYNGTSPYAEGPVPTRYSHQDYVDDMKSVAGDVQRGTLSQMYHRVVGATDHPVLNDLPPANIRPVAAIEAVRYYEAHPDQFKGDPFGWNQYKDHYDKLVGDMALGSDAAKLKLSVQISAVNAARINDDLDHKVSNWKSLTQDQRDEAITAYSASGGKQFNKEYAANDHKPFVLRPESLSHTDGANTLTGPKGDAVENIQRLHSILDAPKHAQLQSPLLNDPSHPGNGLYQQAYGKLAELDGQVGRSPDQRTANLAGAATVAALGAGITRVDHMLPDIKGGSTMLVAQNTSPLKTVAEVPTVQGMNTPLEQSSAQYRQVAQQQTQDQQQSQTQNQTQVASQQQAQPAMQIQMKQSG